MDVAIQGARPAHIEQHEAVFALRLEDALREIADPGALAGSACALIGGYFRVSQVWMVTTDGEAARVGAWPGPSSDGCLSLAQLGGSLRAQLAAGRAVCAADVRLDPRLAADTIQRALSSSRVLSLSCAPVLREGRLAAVLLAAHDRPRPWLESELAQLATASARAFSAHGRAAEVADLRRSEAEHRLAVALCPQVFWTATAEGRMDKLSPLFGELASKRPDQRGLGWRRTTHPDDLQAVERAVAHCMRTGDTYDIEHRTIDPDGRPRWIHSHGKPSRGPDGKIVRWFGTITDIDRRKRAEQALRASEDRFLRAIAGARVGTWDWNMTTDEVMASPGYEPQFHDQPEGSMRSSRDFLDAVHPDDRARLAQILSDVQQEAQASGSAEYQAEYRVIRQNGEVRWLGALGSVTITPGSAEGGHLAGMTVDMSERRRTEEMLTATQDRLRALNADLEATVRREMALRERAQTLLAQAQRMEALGQLAGGIAHDFNNVLRAVMGGLDLMERQADRPEAVRRLAARVGEAASRGVAITGRLLAFARRSDLQAETVEVVPLLEGLCDLLAPTLKVGIAMQVSAPPDLPMLLVDRAQLETALVNLAVNARDAMPDGGLITLAAAPADGDAPGAPSGLASGRYVRVSVQDTGTGMTADVLTRATEPFFTTKPTGQGTGLGLAMAHGFTEQSGGGLTLSSTLGEGTTVSLWFRASGSKGPEPKLRQLAIVAPHEAPHCVLVVDDDHVVRAMLVSQIQDLGSLVIEAQTGEEALARLADGAKVDALVTDYAMPGMNGGVLTARVRERHPCLPVLMLTGHVDESLRVETGAWDAATFMLLRKPASSEALKSAFARLKGRDQRSLDAHGPSNIKSICPD